MSQKSNLDFKENYPYVRNAYYAWVESKAYLWKSSSWPKAVFLPFRIWVIHNNTHIGHEIWQRHKNDHRCCYITRFTTLFDFYNITFSIVIFFPKYLSQMLWWMAWTFFANNQFDFTITFDGCMFQYFLFQASETISQSIMKLSLYLLLI